MPLTTKPPYVNTVVTTRSHRGGEKRATDSNVNITINFKILLYMPIEVPQNFTQGKYYQYKEGGNNIYVIKLLIYGEFEITTHYLRFIKVLVDSSDLSLNVNQ